MVTSIFNPTGSVSKSILQYDEQTFKAYITLSVVGGSDVLLGYAPITGVKINQLTDFSLTKSLDRDFLVATFGDTPTRIQLNGLNFFNLNGCELSSDGASKQQIMAFYKENKVSNDPQKRIDIAITSDDAPITFRCIIVGLDTQNTASKDGTSNLVYTYNMTLIGVDKDE